MVEVAQDNKKSLVLLPKHITTRYFHVIKRDVRSASSWRVGRFDRLCLYARASLYEEHSETLGCLACDCKIVAEDTVGDPSRVEEERLEL